MFTELFTSTTHSIPMPSMCLSF